MYSGIMHAKIFPDIRTRSWLQRLQNMILIIMTETFIYCLNF